VCVISSTKIHYCCCYSCCCYLDAVESAALLLITYNPTLLIREYLSSLVLAHEGPWPLRASCPFLHMALSIEPKAACTLNLLVTGSVTQVSLLLPSFPAFVSSHGSSNAKLECLTATAGPGQLPRTTVYLTAAGSIFFILFFGRIGMRFRISNGFNLFPFWILHTAASQSTRSH